MASTAALPWLWVIETLADLKQIDSALLRVLIPRIPDFLTDASEAVRERVALQYLEECCSSGSISTSGSGPGINVARPNEDVLCCYVWKVTDLGSLEKCCAELFTQDLHQFILQKRAALPKFSLDLLKDSILEGHSQGSIFLNESSGLSNPCPVDNLQCNNDVEHEHVNMLKFSTVDCEIHSQIQGSITLAPGSSNLDLQEEPFQTEKHLPKQNVSDVDSRNHLQKYIANTGGNDVWLVEKVSTDQLSGEKSIGLNDGEFQSVNQATALAVDSGSASL